MFMELHFNCVEFWLLSRGATVLQVACFSSEEMLKPQRNPDSKYTMYVYMEVSKNGDTPKSSISIGFSLIKHPFWGTPHDYGNPHMTKLFPFRKQYIAETQYRKRQVLNTDPIVWDSLLMP